MRRPAPLPARRDPDRQIPGLQYVELAPGVLSFVCAAYRCRLRPSACAVRWRRAEAEADAPVNHFSIHIEDAHGDLSRCMGCPLGAQHAGLPKPPERSILWRQAGLCCRCGHGGDRLVGSRVCISCYNRGQEWLRGRNSKGTAPIYALPVAPMSLAYTIDGAPVRVHKVSQAADAVELALYLLRKSSGRLVFFPADVDAMLATQQRSMVRFRRVVLDIPIGGHVEGVEAVDDPAWKAPLTRRVPRRSVVAAERRAAESAAASGVKPAARCRKVQPAVEPLPVRVSKLAPEAVIRGSGGGVDDRGDGRGVAGGLGALRRAPGRDLLIRAPA